MSWPREELKVCSAHSGTGLWNSGCSLSGLRPCFSLSWLLLAVLLHGTLQNEAVALLVFASEINANFVWIFLAVIFYFTKTNYLGRYFDVHQRFHFFLTETAELRVHSK